MQSIPFEVVRHVNVEYLSTPDILNLCSTSKEYQEICRDNNLWIFLLKRDYGQPFSGPGAKEEYFYFKYIHDISDIPVQKVIQLAGKYKISFTAVDAFLDLLGYKREGLSQFESGQTYKLSNLDAEDAYGYMEHALAKLTREKGDGFGVLTGLAFFGNAAKRAEKMLEELLPKIFVVENKGVEIAFSDFAEIYDFYNGQDTFWSGFLNYLVDSDLVIFPKILDQMKKEIYRQ